MRLLDRYVLQNFLIPFLYSTCGFLAIWLVFDFMNNANEFIEYVDAGMTPMQSLTAGTSDAAEAGGIKGIGTLEPGMAADVVGLAVSPLQDIHAVQNVSFVMRDGIIFKQSGAEKPLQQASIETSDVRDAF